MTKILIDKETVELALEALGNIPMADSDCDKQTQNEDDAIQEVTTALRQALAVAEQHKQSTEQEPNFKKAYLVWQEKTEWVQETVQLHELGMHRADVLRQRIEQSNNQKPASCSCNQGQACNVCDPYILVDSSSQPQEAAPRNSLTDEMVTLGAKALAKLHADSCGLDFDDVWKYYADEHKDDARAVLIATHGIKE